MIWCLVRGTVTSGDPRSTAWGALGPAQLACPTCRRRNVCFSQWRGPTRVTPDLALALYFPKKEVLPAGGVWGIVGVCFRRRTDTGHTASTRGHVVKVAARWLPPAPVLLTSASGTSAAPALRIRLGFLRRDRIKGRMLKHMVLLGDG